MLCIVEVNKRTRIEITSVSCIELCFLSCICNTQHVQAIQLVNYWFIFATFFFFTWICVYTSGAASAAMLTVVMTQGRVCTAHTSMRTRLKLQTETTLKSRVHLREPFLDVATRSTATLSLMKEAENANHLHRLSLKNVSGSWWWL